MESRGQKEKGRYTDTATGKQKVGRQDVNQGSHKPSVTRDQRKQISKQKDVRRRFSGGTEPKEPAARSP